MLACPKAKCVLFDPGIERCEQGQYPWTLPDRAAVRSPTTSSVSYPADELSLGMLSLPLVLRQTATHTLPQPAAANL